MESKTLELWTWGYRFRTLKHTHQTWLVPVQLESTHVHKESPKRLLQAKLWEISDMWDYHSCIIRILQLQPHGISLVRHEAYPQTLKLVAQDSFTIEACWAEAVTETFSSASFFCMPEVFCDGLIGGGAAQTGTTDRTCTAGAMPRTPPAPIVLGTGAPIGFLIGEGT